MLYMLYSTLLQDLGFYPEISGNFFSLVGYFREYFFGKTSREKSREKFRNTSDNNYLKIRAKHLINTLLIYNWESLFDKQKQLTGLLTSYNSLKKADRPLTADGVKSWDVKALMWDFIDFNLATLVIG